MASKQPAKGRGGKLNRSEIVHLRLNPRTRFALELMAKSQNRTVSSFLETLVNQALGTAEIKILPPAPRSVLPPYVDEEDLKSVPLQELLKLTWHVDEIHRFVAMCIYTPHLLSYEEEQTWTLIRGTSYYWSYYEAPKVHEDTGESLGKERVRIHTIDGVVWEHVKEHWQWLLEDNSKAIFDDIRKKDMALKPGKIVATPPGGFPKVHKTITDDEMFDLVNRLNKHFDKHVNTGEK